jgi:intron-binding protein aquarius
MDGPNSSLREQTALLVFLNHCFNSMEVELIRDQVKRLVSLSMWVSLQQVNTLHHNVDIFKLL